jgi:hypothetical protein
MHQALQTKLCLPSHNSGLFSTRNVEAFSYVIWKKQNNKNFENLQVPNEMATKLYNISQGSGFHNVDWIHKVQSSDRYFLSINVNLQNQIL